ncbi:MAG: hypothetical protein IIZ25_05875 [Thermoguttaceae bacterium]|nr:hypothetical protein [Thermoguttaceae bacterium]
MIHLVGAGSLYMRHQRPAIDLIFNQWSDVQSGQAGNVRICMGNVWADGHFLRQATHFPFEYVFQTSSCSLKKIIESSSSMSDVFAILRTQTALSARVSIKR